jgi:hypothetical protein
MYIMGTKYFMFYKLNCKIDPEKFLAYERENTKLWIREHGFDILMLPVGILGDSLLAEVVKKFQGKPVILKMAPWRFYNFHIDTKRYCAINSLLSGYDSHSYFGSDSYKNEKLIYELENLVPLDYTLGSCYVFNTKHRHGVVNRSETRLTLSIGFLHNEYEEVLAYCQQRDL